MAKKHFTYEDEFDEEEELLLDRKAKRKRERERQRREEENKAPQQPQDTTMDTVVGLCQECRWREAELQCLSAIERYHAEGKEDAVVAVENALKKIDRSLRRQMIASFVNEASKMLNY